MLGQIFGQHGPAKFINKVNITVVLSAMRKMRQDENEQFGSKSYFNREARLLVQ
jgi:hypothetical protein